MDNALIFYSCNSFIRTIRDYYSNSTSEPGVKAGPFMTR